jgi:hypothetical protein
MSWNIELAFVRILQDTDFKKVVPDVFENANQNLGFEDATSVMRGTDLCTTWLMGWALVIDVNCRLSGLPSYLQETSKFGELFVFRISGEPLEVHYKAGTELERRLGNAAVLESFGESKYKSEEYVDGELLAWELMQHRTGISLDDLWKARFSVFVVS